MFINKSKHPNIYKSIFKWEHTEKILSRLSRWEGGNTLEWRAQNRKGTVSKAGGDN